jgi:SAM-dependent methyltransferase
MSGGAPYETHTGAVYFQRITAREVNRRVRSRFQELVLRLAPPGARLFDFGAGPGIDARFFAERGFTVEAYDVDPSMCEFFTTYCRELINSARVTLDRSGYREFLSRKSTLSGHPADLVISNFGPLNQVDELPELFAKFHVLTTPTGKLLLSVLTPYFIGDMKTRWWWRNAPRLWRTGHVSVQTGGAPPHTRRRLADFRASSLPYFELTRVFPGLSSDPKRQPDGIDVSRAGRCAWLRLAPSQFMILLFEKRDPVQFAVPTSRMAPPAGH